MSNGGQEASLWNSPVLRKWWLSLRSPGTAFDSDDHVDSPSDSPPGSNLSRELSIHAGLLAEDGTTPLSDQAAEMEPLGPSMKTAAFKEELARVRLEYMDKEAVKIVAATWNVAGLPPQADLDLDDWLRVHEDPPPDIYVIGFQEIVPLTANNLLGQEVEQSKQWNEKLRSALERKDTSFVSVPLSPPSSHSRLSPLNSGVGDLAGSPAEQTQDSAQNGAANQQAGPMTPDARFSPGDPEGTFAPGVGGRELQRLARQSLSHLGVDTGDSVRVADADLAMFANPNATTDGSETSRFLSDLRGSPASPVGSLKTHLNQRRYSVVASRQMVGIHLVVWVRTALRRYVKNLKVSCVPCGIMGVLGNKGSVAVSLTLHETSFCFIGAHLTAGEKEADGVKRVQDVQEVLRRTVFSWTDTKEDLRLRKYPETVKDHDRVIWVGDFNFRLDMADGDVRNMLDLQLWDSMLTKDQLRMEMRTGGSLEDWREGEISFPPTYKYVINSKKYVGEDGADGDKRRTPAWCDRILWFGEGLRIVHYGRSEILMSDHRPVTAVIVAEVRKWTDSRWRDAIARARTLVGAREHRTKPQCKVEPHAVNFGEVKYAREAVSSVELANVGEVTAHFRVRPPPGGAAGDSLWVWVEPSEGTLEPGEVRTLHLKACVTAAEVDVQKAVQSSERELVAYQVVSLENGGDLFLACSATYLPSCWGLSLEMLASIPGPVREYRPPSANGDARPANGVTTAIPKELQRLVAYLLEAGMDGPNAFDAAAVGIETSEWDGNTTTSQSSLPLGQVSWHKPSPQMERQVASVREALDTGASFPPGTTPQLVGTTLILFLRALPQAVVAQEASESIDKLEASGKELAPMDILAEIGIDGVPLMVLNAILVLIQQLLRNRIANEFAIREIAAVFASAIFPQQGGVDKKTYRRQTKFLKDLIEQS